MAFDGIYLSLIKNQINELKDARIDKISEPSQDEIIISLRGKGIHKKLIFSINPSIPRLHFTEKQAESPLVPPMFCSLLRKHLASAKLLGAEQLGFDRVLSLSFEARNDFGDLVTLKLICEIMSRRSNLILVSQDGKIIDALKRVSIYQEASRAILPGVVYELPQREEKLSPLEFDENALLERLKSSQKQKLWEALTENLEGLSPLVAKELSFLVAGSALSPLSAAFENEENLLVVLKDFKEKAKSSNNGYIVYKKSEEEGFFKESLDTPTDFSFIPITHFGNGFYNKECQDFSLLLDEFYERKAVTERIKSKSADLRKLLQNNLERAKRKLATREKELLNAGRKESFKIMGDILSANLYSVKKGDKELKAQNFYSENYEEIIIPLDERKSPSQNLEKFYKEYKRLSSAEEKLKTLISDANEEILYLESAIDILKRCETESELMELREELCQEGYVKKSALIEKEKKLLGQSKGKKLKQSDGKIKFSPKKYVSKEGFTILCGKNNLENDHLTFKTAKGGDLWLHVKDIPGSHIIIVSDGKEIPEETIFQAAVVAVTNSSAKLKNTKTTVDYTLAKNVKKPKGAKPGRVIYTSFKSCLATPNEEFCEEISWENLK